MSKRVEQRRPSPSGEQGDVGLILDLLPQGDVFSKITSLDRTWGAARFVRISVGGTCAAASAPSRAAPAPEPDRRDCAETGVTFRPHGDR
jgi:hypothetical protein